MEDLTTCKEAGRQTVDTQGGIEFGGRGLEERDRGLLNDHEALLLTFIQGLELGAFAKCKEIVINRDEILQKLICWCGVMCLR